MYTMLRIRTSSRVNEARGAKDTLGILFWGVMHKRFEVITSGDFCYDLKSLLSNVEQFKPLRFGADEELSDGGPEHPPSPDHVPSPKHLPSPVEPLPANALTTALSPGYVADSDPDEDPEEDPEEDHADYPADGGDDDDEPSDDDDDDTDDEDEEPFKNEDDDEEEEEHLALADPSVVPVVDPVPSAEDTKAFETDKYAPTPRSPQTKVSFAQTHLRRARKTVRLKPPMSPSKEARIAEYAVAPTPPPSPLSPWLCPTAPTLRYEVGESSTAAPRPTGGHRADYRFIGTMDAKIRRQRAEEVGYGIKDVWVDPIEAVEEVAPTTLEGVNARVTELAAVQKQDTQDIYAVIEDVHYELQAYMTHTQMHDYRIVSQESLMTKLIAHVSSLQEQLSAALGQIQELQARDQTHADDPEGAGSSA
ncbi:hypothetical protein Tco_1301588 [Tanacetum coccineum]